METAQKEEHRAGEITALGLDSQIAGEFCPTAAGPLNESPAHSEFEFLLLKNQWAVSGCLLSTGVYFCRVGDGEGKGTG